MSQFAKTFDLVDRGQVLVIKTRIEDIKTGENIPCLEVYSEIEGELLNLTIEVEDQELQFQKFNQEAAISCYDVLKECWLDDMPELPGRVDDK